MSASLKESRRKLRLAQIHWILQESVVADRSGSHPFACTLMLLLSSCGLTMSHTRCAWTDDMLLDTSLTDAIEGKTESKQFLYTT